MNQLATKAGQVLYYTLTVTNNDTRACGGSTFNLTSAVAPGLSSFLRTKVLVLEPGESDLTMLQVGSVPWISSGPYSLSATATNSTIPQVTASVTGSYILNTTPTTLCTRVSPLVTLANPNQSVSSAGQSVSYTVIVTNHDTLGCGVSTFSFTPSAAAGLSFSMNVGALVLEPGQSNVAVMQVGNSTSLSNGTYPISITAANQSASHHIGSVRGSFVVNYQNHGLDQQAAYRPYVIELLSLLEPSSQEYSNVNAWAKQGNFVQAMKAYRNDVVYRLRALDFGVFSSNTYELSPEDVIGSEMLVGRMTYKEYLKSYSQRYNFTDYFGMRGDPNLVKPIQWFPQVSIGDVTSQYCSFSFTSQLATQFLQTRDPIYLLKWFQIFSDFAQNQKKLLSQQHNLSQIDCDWSGQSNEHLLEHIARTMNTIHSAAIFAKALPGGTRPNGWLDALTPQSGSLSQASLDLIPEIQLYQSIKTWVFDHPGPLLSKFVPPGAAPTQRDMGLQAVAVLLHTFREYQHSAHLYPLFLGSTNDSNCNGCGGMLGDLTTNFYPDGAMLERSTDYTQGSATTFRFITKLLQLDPPFWSSTLSSKVSAVQKFFAALTTPFRENPRIGNNTEHVAPPLWNYPNLWKPWTDFWTRQSTNSKSIRICQTNQIDCWGPNPGAIPSFTSIGFPYSGHYALRKTWDTSSPYLYFSTGPYSLGHNMADVNSVQLTAYGRPMLVTSGPSIYNDPSLSSGMRKYFSEENTFKTNTVVVNSQSQHTGVVDRAARTNPLPTRWATSSYFDFTEGMASLGYGSTENGQAVNRSFNHQRQIIFLRELELWLVIDQMTANVTGAVGNFTQLWHFQPFSSTGNYGQLYTSEEYGFSNDQVIVNQGNKSIMTQDPGPSGGGMAGPNLALYHFGIPSLGYAKHFGSTVAILPIQSQPVHAGWYSPGPSGSKYPAVEVWANWSGSGNQQLVTLLLPNPSLTAHPNFPMNGVRQSQLRMLQKTDLSDATKTGFTATLSDGSSLTFLSSLQPTTLTVNNLPNLGSISVVGGTNKNAGGFLQGNALLVRFDPNAQHPMITGIILGAQQVMVGNQLQSLAGDFIFRLAPSSGQSGMTEVSPIKVPNTFKWVQTPNGEMPQWNQ